MADKSIIEVLDAVDNAMSVVKNLAEAPGINLIPYVNVLSSVIGTVHMAYAAGKSVLPYAAAINDTFDKSKPAPSEADMAALDAKIKALEAKIDAPMPPREGDEPE